MPGGEVVARVAAVELRTGELVGLPEFQTAVEEIFDIQVLPGLRFPEVIGFQQEAVHHTFIVPGGGGAPHLKPPSPSP